MFASTANIATSTESDQFGNVAPDLVGAVREHADELEIRMREYRAHSPLRHVARGPLHDAQSLLGPRHRRSVIVSSPASYRTPGSIPPSISIVVPLM